MATPDCLILADTSPASTPAPDYRCIAFQNGATNDGQPVFQKENSSVYVWYNAGDATWRINGVVGDTSGNAFSSATISGDFSAIGGATGSINVSDGGEVRKYLKEKDARMVYIGTAGIPRTQELHRRWDKIKDKQTQDCIDLLYSWTSAENYNEQYYVEDPRAVGPRGDQVWDGRWRLVNVIRQGDAPEGITEILRFGFQKYSGTPSDPLDQSEARLGQGQANTVTGDLVFVQEWRYTDPEDHDDILGYMAAIKTVTNPTVEGETITGVFACSNITSQPNEDGSILIRRTLTELHSITALANLTALAPIISQEEEFLNLFAWEPGDEEKLVYVHKNINPTSQAYCMETLTAANLETIPGGTWELYDRKFEEDPQDGTATFTVLFMKETWDADYDDKNTVRVTEASGWARAAMLQATGESQAQALSDFAASVIDFNGAAFAEGTQYNKGDAVQYSGSNYICISPHLGTWSAADFVKGSYLLGTRDMQHAGRGEYVLTGQMVPAYDGTTAGDAITISNGAFFTDSESKFGVRVWWKRSAAAKDTLVTAETGEANLAWTHEGNTFQPHHWSVQDHGDGTYTVRQFGFAILSATGGTLDAAYYVVRIKPGITTNDQPLIMRVWPNITEAAKDELIANGGTARSDKSFGSPLFASSTAYVHADCWVQDGGQSGYTVRQLLVFLEAGTANEDATITRITPDVRGGNARLQRTWYHRTEDAMTTLTTSSGNAISDYTYDGNDYTHADCLIVDRGRGGFDVVQTLILFDVSYSFTAAPWSEDFLEYKYFTRSKDEKIQIVTYRKYLFARVTEKQAWDAIDDLITDGTDRNPADTANVAPVSGTARVKRIKGGYLGSLLVLLAVSDWKEQGDFPSWPKP